MQNTSTTFHYQASNVTMLNSSFPASLHTFKVLPVFCCRVLSVPSLTITRLTVVLVNAKYKQQVPFFKLITSHPANLTPPSSFPHLYMGYCFLILSGVHYLVNRDKLDTRTHKCIIQPRHLTIHVISQPPC